MSFSKYPFFLLLTAMIGCVASRKEVRQLRQRIETNPVFAQSFCGFALYDMAQQQTVYSYNAERYFTPASNTKIFTFYTSLRMLGDSIPALKYTIRHDSLFFRGTGDPAFLHPDLHSDQAYRFLNQRGEKLCYVPAPYEGGQFGPGWAWDDYNDDYSAEKATFPIYGNFARFTLGQPSGAKVQPDFFMPNISVKHEPGRSNFVQRSLTGNIFTYIPWLNRANPTQDVPFDYSPDLLLQLLRDTLKREVSLVNLPPEPMARTLYSVPADSLYKRMMQESDNFIAEQLLLLCSSTLSDTLSSEQAIRYAKKQFLADLPDRPVWVDGSGLSRYNLFTPRSIVALWLKIYQQVPRERLFPLLAAGGQPGTLKNLYQQQNGSFVFGKTGSLSNNLCISGFLLTRSGKTLVFSFMHSNFVVSAAQIRKEMVNVLTDIYLTY